MWRALCLLLLVAPRWAPAAPADELRVLPPPAPGRTGSSLAGELRSEALALLAARRDALFKIKTADEMRRWQTERRDIMLRQLGGLPERTPLNARIVGTLPGDGFRIEKVTYESRPNHRVTANLYLPTSAPPYPGVIVPNGHNPDGKTAEVHQRVGMLMARNGIAALIYDPIGQGERLQVLDREARPLSRRYDAVPDTFRPRLAPAGRPPLDPTSEHILMGIGSILVGQNVATYRIYDGIRSLDYLASRPDIDARRLGCTGNSGGGTLTSYLMALDDRILAAAPACFLTTFQRLLQGPGPQDAEQNIYGQIALGLDEPDYILMRAPKPTLLLAGARDATFDIVGTWDAFREGKRGYLRLGFPERIDMVEADEPHGFTQPLRIGATRWMRRWLLQVDDAIEEPELPLRKESELHCTPDGLVMRHPKEKSVFDFNLVEAARLSGERVARWRTTPREAMLGAVRATAAVRRLEQVPAVTSRTVGTLQRSGYRIDKVIFESPGHLPVPALDFVPVQPSPGIHLHLHGDGKQADAAPGGALEAMARAGHRVVALDLHGIGETSNIDPALPPTRWWARGHFGRDSEMFWLAYLLGKSLVGIRAENVMAIARHLAGERPGQNRAERVHVFAQGATGLPALHAAALEPQLFSSLSLRQTLASWEDVLRTPFSNAHLAETVHGALRVYDLSNLAREARERGVAVTFEDSIVPE